MRTYCRFAAIVLATMSFVPVATEVQAVEEVGEAKRAGKKIAFMAGRRSHGYGSHEHYAGCALLARALEDAMPEYETIVYRDGWPAGDDAFADCDVIVMYSDGGRNHPVNRHLEQVDALAKAGVGIVCIHYAVEVPKGESGDRFLDWIGGYFETHWSVNPHWTAEFKEMPDHPVARGVEPFSMHDEWYYHMRFREQMANVTPILTAIPPASTLSRPDGAHSGNPHVRAKAGQPQHVAWVAERENGGRGFGFTGGHVHWNWGEPNFRKVVLNAIVWAAHDEVPENGVEDKPLTLEQLEENQDFEQPQNFNRDAIRDKFKLGSSGGDRRQVKPLFASPVVTTKTPNHMVDIKVDLKDAKELYLVVRDGGNGYACDWVNWIEPRLVGDAGELYLTELAWTTATSDWGSVHKNKNANGQPMRVNGQSIENGLGTHANSMIGFRIPEGYSQFVARGGLDNGGTDQGGCGQQASAQFVVYNERPSAPIDDQRDPANAIAALDVADGVEATLAASEPELLSLTNLDIDHRGRVWVCEVVNYRKHNGKRPEGDRILILEDTDQDGVMDKSKVFYQGRDVDSAMGICVLGNKVIVSASPNIWVFTDEDGDDVPDSQELLFSKTGQPQHDHSAHSFVFGPDGKLYWNFGNTGKSVHDAEGNLVVDMAGNEVVDNGKPYWGGMVFRCNMDGSDFEVLGHNFRNNYEVAVDSFGGLWQSDNDDDGNRGVRINFVMEFGNYGYRDELTGAGWKDARTGMHEEIPLRHWHLRDPGVVPNLLQTGAGSPTGIMVYEGDLLPEPFRNQVIHCDAGPNIVRAYPVEADGAGYRAESLDLLHGARDQWFRPADVCVAPDGSVFVTDWYDPGVGGHNMGDLERGRLFRIAPPGTKYDIPEYDYTTVEGAIAALRNPSQSVRYLAWTSLKQMGSDAKDALLKMCRDEDPRMRARALWLLVDLIPIDTHMGLAITDKDPNVRIVGIRLARQMDLPLSKVVALLCEDPSPQVRREAAIALRHDDSDLAVQLWAQLAMQHDGKDRWYLEALGIGSDLNADACFAEWLKRVGDNWNTPAGRDIIWRSRAEIAPRYLAKILLDPETAESDQPRYFRALDFHDGPEKEKALVDLLGLEP